MDIISKEILSASFKEKMLRNEPVSPKESVDVVATTFGSKIPRSGTQIDSATLGMLNSLKSLHRNSRIVLSGKYMNGLDYAFKNRGSIIDRIARGAFSASGNTLNDNWTDLFDAIRLDLTIRKMENPTVRQFIYDELSMPNASKDVRVSELYPYGVVFEENNGEGQSVKQGAYMGGGSETIPMKIYAAGFMWTLLAALFDSTYDMSRLTEGVALGEAAKKDDLAIAPILAGTYAGAKATTASTVGTLRQELLMNTLMDAIDDLGDRVDPVTDRKIVAEGLVLLGSSKDIRHVAHVMSGLGNSTPEKYNPLSQISRLVAYDGETIEMPDANTVYAGATNGTVFLIKPSRYFKIPIKRGLTAEIDETPDVKTLAQSERAWYFVESIYNSVGIDSFVQKVTLPAW